MPAKQIDPDALVILYKAIVEYREKLAKNRLILMNAANVCDQAMGSDPISQKKIARLEEALRVLDASSAYAERAAERVLRKYCGIDTIITEA